MRIAQSLAVLTRTLLARTLLALPLSLSLSLSSCGQEDTAPPQRTHSILLGDVSTMPQGRTEIAQVNGVPIFDDCVVRQAKSSGLSAREALQECVDFELLAQEATSFVSNSEVQKRGKQELVRAFVTGTYPILSADDIPLEVVRKLWNLPSTRKRYQHPELRNIVFCRIPPPEGDATTKLDQTGFTFLQYIYEKLKGRTNLIEEDLFGECYPHYKDEGIPELVLNTFHLYPRQQYAQQFRAPIFDGPQLSGMVLPPVKTSYGWDLILLTDVRPELNRSFADAEKELRDVLFAEPIYESWRNTFFDDWASPFEAKHDVQRFVERIPVTPVLPGA